MILGGQQVLHPHLQRVGELPQVRDADVDLAALDPADHGPVDAGPVAELFLAEVPGLAEP